VAYKKYYETPIVYLKVKRRIMEIGSKIKKIIKTL